MALTNAEKQARHRQHEKARIAQLEARIVELEAQARICASSHVTRIRFKPQTPLVELPPTKVKIQMKPLVELPPTKIKFRVMPQTPRKSTKTNIRIMPQTPLSRP